MRQTYCGNGSLPECRESLWKAIFASGDEIAVEQGDPDPGNWRCNAAKTGFISGLPPIATFQQILESALQHYYGSVLGR